MVAVAERSWISGLIVAALALAVQTAYLAEGRNDPTFRVPVVDSATYHESAVRFAEGGPLALGAFWQPPLFPLLLGLLYRLVGPDILAAKILLAALAVFDCVALCWIGTVLFSRQTGIIAGLMLATYGPFVFFSTQLLPVGLAISLILAVFCIWLWCLQRPNSRRWILLGMAIGAAMLTVTNAGVFLPLVILVMLIFLGRDGKWSQALKTTWLTVLGVVVVILPVTLRNRAVSGEWVVVSTHGGINFYLGNNPQSDRTIAVRPGEEWNRMIRGSVLAGAATHAEQSAFFTHLALAYVVKQPDRFLAGLWHKTRQLLAARELPRNVDPYVYRDFSNLLRVLMWRIDGFAFPWGIVAPLALAGWILTRRTESRTPVQSIGRTALAGWIAAYGASVILFFVSARYRLPLVPPMIVFAAAALDHLGKSLFGSNRPLRFRFPGVALITAILLGLVINRPVAAPTDGFNFRAELHMCIGQRFAGLSQWPEAERELRRSLALDPEYAEAHAKLANLLAQTGQFDEAKRLAERACTLDRDSAEARWVLGDLLHRQERLPAAAAAFESALQVDATSPEAHAGLAEVLRQSGESAAATAHYRSSARFASEPGPVLLRMADLHLERGEFGEAIACFRRALRAMNPDAETINSFAWLLATCPQVELRDCHEAMRLAERSCSLTEYKHASALDTLAAAHAECGRFQEAVRFAQQALNLALSVGDGAAAVSIRGRLKLYEERLNKPNGLKNAPPPTDP